ncbi:hypothetical protein B0T16DRAFT_447877 [Cercophora newfieldiana]|uniref:Heterokaryon incompatibility domain-containing protein n=1 Tax=Cercophora newfieldiana TaxID=92897 RepID=A0AA39Y184_9PEZI|nr:hypothetical protein B0T16DRAFT_447877 [Cercophora newfieldiana]
MRLIDTSSLRLVSRHDSDLPDYAILSHTWGSDDDEVSFQDLQTLLASRVRRPDGSFDHPIMKKPGFAKIEDSASLAKCQGFQYIWIDTCCIDKTSSAELSEAINSMFRWYRNAAVCYAFLDDVDVISDRDYRVFLQNFGPHSDPPPRHNSDTAIGKKLQSSRWFTRGWTLQELIAPLRVEFYTKGWLLLGNKVENRLYDSGHSGFPGLISRITGVDLAILQGKLELDDLSIGRRMRWAARRQTTRIEDRAYCLMGIFGVNMPLLYGEGNRAFIRLQEEILKATDDQSIFAWQCSRTDPLRFQLCGLLAPEPSCFEDADAKPLPRDTSRVSAPFAMTNAGLHIFVFMVPSGDADGLIATDGDVSTGSDYLAILSCSPIQRGTDYYSVAVQLTSLGGDLYARVYPEALAYVPSSRLDMQDAEGWRYIYVKQPPNHPLPDIVLDPASFRASVGTMETTGEIARLVACYPPQPFTALLPFKPTTALKNSVLAAFRYFSYSRPDLQVDIFVGLVPGRQGSRQLWCAQQQAPRGMLLHDTATYFDSTPFTRIRSEFRRDRHSFLDLSAQVETVRSYKGTSILLSLSRINELPDILPVEGSNVRRMLPAGKRQFVKYNELDAGLVPGSEPDPSEQPAPYPKPNNQSEEELVGDADWEAPPAESIAHLVHPLVVEDAFELNPHLTAISQRTRIRVAHAKTKRPLEARRNRRRQFAEMVQTVKSKKICLEETQEAAEVEPVQLYHSLVLVRACIENDLEAVSELLSSPLSGAMVEVQTCVKERTVLSSVYDFFRKFKPIHWAALLGHYEVLHILVNHDADIFSRTGSNLSAAHLAILTNNVEFLRRLFEISPIERWEEEDTNVFESKETLVNLMTAYIKSERIEDFLALSMGHIGSRWRNSLWETPLHRAAAMGNVAVVSTILERSTADLDFYGIDPPDRRGRTPIWHACASGEHEVVEVFLRYQVDLNHRDNDNMSALEAACRGGHSRIVNRLIQAGAEIVSPGDWVNVSRMTAIQLAALSGDVDTIQVLLDHGARAGRITVFHEPDSGLTSGVTALLIAVANGWSDCVRLLCEAGCKFDLPENVQLLAVPLVDGQGQGRLSIIRAKPLTQVAEVYGRHAIAGYLHLQAHGQRRTDTPTGWTMDHETGNWKDADHGREDDEDGGYCPVPYLKPLHKRASEKGAPGPPVGWLIDF